MPYNSDLTGERIKNTDQMVTVTVYDEPSGEYVQRYLKDLAELKKWWLVGKPHKGGKIELSSHKHEEIDDETQKVTIKWNNQDFTFRNLAEAKEWYSAVKKQ